MNSTRQLTRQPNQLDLARALRIPWEVYEPAANFGANIIHEKAPSSIAFVGAGGKTTAIFQLARNLPPPVIVSTTTHMGLWQIGLADKHIIVKSSQTLTSAIEEAQGVILVTGPIIGDRTNPLSPSDLSILNQYSTAHQIPLLIEADGARQKPLKAPALHEPNLPDFIDLVIVVAGLSGLTKPLNDRFVHRPELFANICEIEPNAFVRSKDLIRFLKHEQGGRKNIPSSARSVVLLNQADTLTLQAAARTISPELVPVFNAVITASLANPARTNGQFPLIHAVHELTGAVLLAAGSAKRYGMPKQILEWRGEPFVRKIARTALQSGLQPVIVVTGAYAMQVTEAVSDLPVKIIHNPHSEDGQASSIRAGLFALYAQPARLPGSAFFLLADQPQVSSEILRALSDEHANCLAPVLAPLVDGRRANPVLFDQMTFPDLMKLTGDTGGRAIFSKFSPAYLPWHDTSLLLDVDYPEDYRRLLEYWE